MQVSPCQPRSSIFETPSAIPALIFSASKPGGKEGSEKSTVSGFWPTNNMRVIGFLRFCCGSKTSVEDRSKANMATHEFAGDIERLARGMQEGEIGGEDVHHALPDVKFGRGAGFRHQIRVSARIIKQDFVLADMELERR